MYLVLYHPSDIRDLSVEQLQYISKVVPLRVCVYYIEHVWDKLPKHVKADSEVRTYHRCDEHYNQPWQRTHIDGPAQKIKDCSECQRRAAVCWIQHKRTSFRVTYSGLPVLRLGHSAYEATSQWWRGHKSAGRGVPRTRHCVFPEQRSHW